MEMVLAALLLSFIVAAVSALYNVAYKQQRIARNYSQVQTDIRAGLRRATRAIRHGYKVVNPSTQANFPVKASNASQMIVVVPDNTAAQRELRLYLSSGTLYAQYQDQTTASATALLSGVTALTFNYFYENVTTKTATDGSPQLATEVQITVTAQQDAATTTVQAYVELRNATLGL
jgi:hypothetical protein